MDLKRIFTFINIYIKRPAGTRENGKMGGNVEKKGAEMRFFYPNIASPLKKKGLLCIFYQLENVLVCVYIGLVAVVEFNIHNIHI